MRIRVYTDASYSKQADVGACGYLVVKGEDRIIKHKVVMMGNVGSSSMAELYSIYHSLSDAFLIKGVKKVSVFTDNHFALCACRREKPTKKFSNILFFEEIKELVALFIEHQITLRFFKVSAHANDRFNNLIDASSRNQLRKYLKKTA